MAITTLSAGPQALAQVPAHEPPPRTTAPSSTLASPAERARADQHLKSGIDNYLAGRYDEAVRELEQGYRLDPRREFLYALGQAERMRGRCEKAVEWYAEYLRVASSPKQIDAARMHIDRCVVELRKSEASTMAETAAAHAKAAQEAADRAHAEALRNRQLQKPPAWYADWVGGVLTGTGIAAAATGLILRLTSEAPRPAQFTNYSDYARAVDDDKSKGTISTVLIASGGALIAGGIVRYWLKARDLEVAPSVALDNPMAMTGMSLRGRF